MYDYGFHLYLAIVISTKVYGWKQKYAIEHGY